MAEKDEEAGRAPLMLHLDSLSGAAPDQPMIVCIKHLHSSLLLICLPGPVAEKGKEAGRAPLMLHLASLAGSADIAHYEAPLLANIQFAAWIRMDM